MTSTLTLRRLCLGVQDQYSGNEADLLKLSALYYGYFLNVLRPYNFSALTESYINSQASPAHVGLLSTFPEEHLPGVGTLPNVTFAYSLAVSPGLTVFYGSNGLGVVVTVT